MGAMACSSGDEPCAGPRAEYGAARTEARGATDEPPTSVIDGVSPRSAAEMRAAQIVGDDPGCFGDDAKRFAEEVERLGVPG
jgi:hypothetical protein